MPKKSAYAELTVFAAGFALILGLGVLDSVDDVTRGQA